MGNVTQLRCEDKGHSPLSPSASVRWMNCPGSVELCKKAPPRPVSEFAEEGTAAHRVAEECLRHNLDPADLIGVEVVTQAGAKFVVDQAMADALTIYVDFVRSFHGKLYVEKPCHLYDGLCDGTADALVVGAGVVDIIDLKYGQGDEVIADWNSQEMIYALGAVKDLNLPATILVRLHIVQPRHFKDQKAKLFEIQLGTLWAWDDFTLYPAVERAVSGLAELIPGEDQCQWCTAASICPAIEKQATAIAVTAPPALPVTFPADVTQFSPEQLSAAITLEASFTKWVKEVKARFDAVKLSAKDRLKGGLPVPGYKLVKGRATRKWADEAKAVEQATIQGVDPFDMTVRSPAQMEAAFKEAGSDPKILADFIATEYGESLVPESDKKQALPIGAEQVFGSIEPKK